MEEQLERALQQVGSRQEMAQALLEYAQSVYGGDHGLLLEMEETTGSLRELASTGDVPEMLNQDMRIFAQFAADHPTDPNGVLIASKVKDVKKLAARKSVRREMTDSVIIFPLAAGTTSMGAVYLGSRGDKGLKFKGNKAKTFLQTGRVLGHLINVDRTLNRLSVQVSNWREKKEQDVAFGELPGDGAEIKRVRRSLELVVDMDIPVTLIGEKGTGRWIAAEALHRNGPRRKNPIVRLPLADIPKDLHGGNIFGKAPGAKDAPVRGRRGAMRDARNGTLILEDAHLLHKDLQRRIARTLESGLATLDGEREEYPVNVRIVMISTRNPGEMRDKGELINDFYLKMMQFPIVFPPLRKRIDDLPALVEHFANEASVTFGKVISGVNNQIYDFLGTYDWPGNLDEFEHEIRQAVLRTPDQGEIGPNQLSVHLISRRDPSMLDTSEGTLKQRVARIEKRMLMEQLEKNRHNQSMTADQLGLSRQALINKLHRYGIETGRKYKRRLREIEAQAQKKN
ncbi:MAG: Hydrogenase transcriptional regulatory protein hupR1 [Calditrichaeota bacterium]|nr:Hydrogenase transcriptional regulatory protein hupR1 [Calditrichota bacterium]